MTDGTAEPLTTFINVPSLNMTDIVHEHSITKSTSQLKSTVMQQQQNRHISTLTQVRPRLQTVSLVNTATAAIRYFMSDMLFKCSTKDAADTITSKLTGNEAYMHYSQGASVNMQYSQNASVNMHYSQGASVNMPVFTWCISKHASIHTVHQ